MRCLQRDPGPWTPMTIRWLATLGVIIIFGLVMLFSASSTTGYLRMGDSLHYIKSQLLYTTVLGLGMMWLFSYIDHRFLRKLVWLGYGVCIVLLSLWFCFSAPLNQLPPVAAGRGALTLQVSENRQNLQMILLTAHLAAKAPGWRA